MKYLPILSALTALLSLCSCASFAPPKGYVPDDKVVYLKEKLELDPIRYEPMKVDPYSFTPYAGSLELSSPAFLRVASLAEILKPDFQADSRLYREAKGHLELVCGSDDFAALRSLLDTMKIEAPPPLSPDKGEKTKDYANGAEYEYPGADGARITTLNTGEYRIDFPDRGSFVCFPDGSYERRDPAGKVVWGLNKGDSSIVASEGELIFTAIRGFKRVVAPKGTAEYSDVPEPQYRFVPPGSKAGYVLFVGEDGKSPLEYSVSDAADIRFDYLVGSSQVLVTSGAQAASIDKDFVKRHSIFDTKLNKATDLLSVYLPEGLRMNNLSGPGLSYCDLIPAWPEGYRAKAVGPFTIYYAAKDEALLTRIDPARLSKIEEADRRLSGLGAKGGRSILIPPDLKSYCMLHASEPGSVLNWYPSGFETRDYIVMWPISVPRYRAAEGQDYFFKEEFSEILAHEYVHLMVGENAGLMSPIPVWLNEGLAVYVESQVSPESKAYWDLCFQVERDRRRLLDWDAVTVHGTGDFPAVKARIHYAQSYALVDALVAKFGATKVAEYVKAFRVKPEEASKVELKAVYRDKFKAVFGIGFEEALSLIKL